MLKPAIGRWMTIDPLAEKYYSVSPYAYCGNNPINRIDPDGRDWYEDEYGNKMWARSQDKTYVDNDEKEWNNTGTSYIYNRKDGSAVYFYQKTNNEGDLVLRQRDFTANEMAGLSLFHSEDARNAAMANIVGIGSFMSAVGKEMLAQWTNPELLVAGATIGVTALSSMFLKTTMHGAQRIAGSGATRGGVLSSETIVNTKALGRQIVQADGAIVYLHEFTPGRFNVVIENQTTGKIVTTMGNWSEKSITRMRKNYGW